MKNIVLFGGSNSVMTDGLQLGLRKFANVTNLALGASTAIQNLYELNRDRNQEAIQNADLIITESNVNEIQHRARPYQLMPIDLILRNLEWFYESLARLNKPVCILILPSWGKYCEKINNMHRYFANLYGFYVIDLQTYYNENDLRSFGEKLHISHHGHQMSVIYKKLGKNIAKNIDDFKNISKNAFRYNLPEFKIITANEMIKHGEIKSFNPKNSNYNEVVFRLEKGNFLELKEYSGYKIIGLHSWLLDENGNVKKYNSNSHLHSASLFIGLLNDANNQIRKHMCMINTYCEIQADITINDDFIVKFNDENLPATEFFGAWLTYQKSYFDLISLFICKSYDKKDLTSLENIPENEIIKIENDYKHLIPDITFFSDCLDFIDEYMEAKFSTQEKYTGQFF